jgi:hypothetical protein
MENPSSCPPTLAVDVNADAGHLHEIEFDIIQEKSVEKQSPNKQQKKANIHIVSPSKNLPSFQPSIISQTIPNRPSFPYSLQDTNKQYQQQNRLIDDVVNHIYTLFCSEILINPASFIYSLLSLTLNIPVLTLIPILNHHHHPLQLQQSSQPNIPAIAAFSNCSSSSSSSEEYSLHLLRKGEVYMGNADEIRLNVMNCLKLLDNVCINRDLKYKICFIFSQIEQASNDETWTGNLVFLASLFHFSFISSLRIFEILN